MESTETLKNYGTWAGWTDRSLQEAEVVAEESGQTQWSDDGLSRGEKKQGACDQKGGQAVKQAGVAVFAGGWCEGAM